jgi:HK97 family phage portal protein
MGALTKAIEKRYSLADMDRDMDAVVYGRETMTGVKISNSTALSCVAYFHGQRLLAETLGIVPLILYARVLRGNGRLGKERAVGERLYTLLHDAPNPEMDAVSFKSALLGHGVGWGNAFAEIEWDMEAGEPVALWPLNVSRMRVGRDDKTREIIYAYTLPSRGSAFKGEAGGGVTVVLPAWRVWHMPAYGFDGIIGYDSIYLAREMLGLTMALQENKARFFGNSSRPDIVLTHPTRLEKQAKDNLKAGWQEAYGGLSQAHRTAILDEGITIKEIGVPPLTAQLLEEGIFQIQEIARLLNVTPHKLMELSHATFSNIEHQDMEFNKYTMGPWYRRWEQACNRKLILPVDRNRLFCEFFEDALLRADTPTRMAAYKERFYMGSLSPNDIRANENENPSDDPMAEECFVQRNMIPISMAGDPGVLGVVTNDGKASIDLGDTVRRIAEREKGNILRSLKKNAADEAGFKAWVGDFYRDFPEYVRRQVEPALGDKAGAVEEFTRNYIEGSRRDLESGDYGRLGEKLAAWEQKKAGEI